MIRNILVRILLWTSSLISITCMFIIVLMLTMLNVIDEITRSIVVTDTVSRRLLRNIFRSRE